MYSLLSGLKGHLKIPEITVDNVIFRIHCTFTTVLLITFSLIITYTQFVAQPIRCMPEKDGIPQHILNLYCWSTSTFTVPDPHDRPSSGQSAFQGIGASRYNHHDYQDTHHKYYSYYQYVSFVLMFQAMFFYFPKWLWLSWERGFMKALVQDLQVGLRSDEDSRDKRETLVAYLGNHVLEIKWYAYRYWLCECLCLVNVIFQMFLVNWFFKGDFLSYGIHIFSLDNTDLSNRNDHMIYVFPRMTKCTFKKFGGSGSVQVFDALCLLPLNIVNEKTYIFLWFWFIILLIMTSLLITYRVIITFSGKFRKYVMKSRFTVINEKEIETVVSKMSVNSFWIVYMMGRNMDAYLYAQVINRLGKKRGSIVDEDDLNSVTKLH